MQRKPVNSSNIASIGYDEVTQVLEIEFSNFSVYQYFNVPAPTYEALMSAPSHGSFLAVYVKGRFPHEKT